MQLSCDRCKKAFDRQNWTRSEWNNKKYHKTRLVCRACRAEGYHAHDLRTYPCHACAGHFGAKKFNHNMVKNFKQRRRLGLECMSCIKDIIAVGVKSEKDMIACAHNCMSICGPCCSCPSVINEKDMNACARNRIQRCVPCGSWPMHTQTRSCHDQNNSITSNNVDNNDYINNHVDK